jgi:putative oxidoreductase
MTIAPGRSLLDRALDPHREYGTILVRLVVGYRLIWGSADNVFSWPRMVEFAEFLQHQGFPFPLPGAVISAGAQFLCGLLFILGAWTRPAALVMLVNFAVALVLVHLGQPFLENYDALVMFFGAGFLLAHGAGRLSVDAAVARRAMTPTEGVPG